LPGQPRFEPTILHQLRRQQLHDLALAFGVTVKKDGTKPEIMPAMLAAESEGVFRGKPVRPEYLAKAAISSDDPPSDEWLKHRVDSSDMDFRRLQNLAKKHGINAFQKGADELRRELEALRVI